MNLGMVSTTPLYNYFFRWHRKAQETKFIVVRDRACHTDHSEKHEHGSGGSLGLDSQNNFNRL